MLFAASSSIHFLFGFVLILISLFLILLVLVQRGRGGGLTGALGGMGGQSAFGTKAGDTFTRVTYGAAIVWICVCMLAIKVLHEGDTFGAGGPSRATVTEGPGSKSTPSATKDGASKEASPASGTTAPPAEKASTEKTDK